MRLADLPRPSRALLLAGLFAALAAAPHAQTADASGLADEGGTTESLVGGPIPTTISYQGVLTDAAGTPVPNASYTVTLRLFAAASGGSAVYAENHTVTTAAGVFSAPLGGGAPTTGTWANVDFDQGYWLETAVGGTTLSPRTKVLAVPYARGLSLPYAPTVGMSGYLLDLTNTTGSGIQAVGTGPYGGRFESASTVGTGVYGGATSTTGQSYGGFFRAASTSGQAITARTSATSGTTYGVYATNPSSAGRGVYGLASSSFGTTFGVHGESAGASGRGVYGEATSTSAFPSYGGYFSAESPSGRGVFGTSSSTTGTTYGGYFTAYSLDGAGVFGWNRATGTVLTYPPAPGVYGRSDAQAGAGVYGLGMYPNGISFGVYGESRHVAVRGKSTGVSGAGWGGFFSVESPEGRAVEGSATSPAYAGWFSGRVNVTGTLTKGGGAFQIDHPLAPERRILRHSFVESPDMMNVYNGTVTTDGAGVATVTLPDYFEALNRDFRYQLTTVGSFSRAMIAEEVAGNRFVIRTEEPGVRVSWQVTGIRHDAWADENRIVIEEDKPAEDQGRYLHPTAFGLPRERGVDYDTILEAQLEAARARIEVAQEAEEAADATRDDLDRLLAEAEAAAVSD